MLTKLLWALGLSGVLMLGCVGAYFYGHHQGYAERVAQDQKAVNKAEQHAAVVNAQLSRTNDTQVHEIQVLNATITTLQNAIQITPLTGGGATTHEIPVSPQCPAVPNPFSSPAFRMLYNAGSRASAPPSTIALSAGGFSLPQRPPGRVLQAQFG